MPKDRECKDNKPKDSKCKCEHQLVDQLTGWRLEIDQIDARLIALLMERFAITKRIGDYKVERNLHIRDFQREEQQFKQIKELAAKHDISESFSEELLRLVIDEAVRRASHNQ